MKKLGLAAISVLFSVLTFAQATTLEETQVSPPTQNPDVKTQISDISHDIRIYCNQKATAKQALVKGDFATAKTDFAIAKTDKKGLKTCAMVLKNEGIDHPLSVAYKEVKKEDKRIIMADFKKILAEKAIEKKAVKSGDTAAAQSAKNNIIAYKKDLKKDLRQSRRDKGTSNLFLVL